MSRVFRDPEYSDAFETCRVRTDGTVKWEGHDFDLSEVLANELIGPLQLGVL